jgi:hypothetical protein
VINVDMRTSKQQRAQATPGFAIQILPDTDLGNAMLIVEDEEGHYRPVTLAMTINEAKELAQDDLRNRMRSVENGTDADGLCPSEYKLWSRGLGGVQTVVATWNASEL